MAYYYVKNGGTATGDAGRYASQQSGSFAALGASGYYDNIVAAISATTSPVAADIINPSDLHDFTSGGGITYTGVTPIPYFVVCVDDSNIDQGRASGRGVEYANANADLTISNQFISGMTLRSLDDIVPQNDNTLYDCELRVDGGGDRVLSMFQDGASVDMVGGVLSMNDSGVSILLSGGGTINLSGVVAETTDTSVTSLFSGGFTSGGGSVMAKGCDFSVISGTLIQGVGSSSGADDSIDVYFDMCELASGVARASEIFKSKNQRVLTTRCSDSGVSAEYQYGLTAFGGDVDDDSAIFRNEDEPFTESNQKISYKIVTNSDASLGSPLWFDFPIKDYAVLSVGATDTLRFYINSAVALTDKDIYIEISYPDGTNKQTPNFLSSAPTTVGGTLDLMAAGAILATDGSSSWTGALANLYQIDLDTSGDVGADNVPIVKVYITKPSTTIQIASEFGQV